MELYAKLRYVLLAIAVASGCAAYWAGGRLDYERDVERFFPDAEELQAYRDLKETFGGNEIVLAVYEDEQLLAADGTGLRRLQAIRERIEQVPGVASVLSLDRALGHWLVQADPKLVARLQNLFEGYTHGRDRKTAALACMLASDQLDRGASNRVIAQLRSVMETLPEPLPRGYLTGEPVLVAEGLALVEQDGQRLGSWSLVLMGITLAACFRKIRWVIFPLVTVQLSIWLTRALLVALGLQLSLVSSMLTAVVTVVGVATVVHIVVHYEQALAATGDVHRAFLVSARSLRAPITWAIVTDAVGFLSLAVSGVTPVRDFGVMMAVGTLMVLCVVILLSPVAVLWRATSRVLPPSRLDQWLERQLVASIPLIFAWRVPLGIAISALLLVVIYGGRYLEVETDFTKNFRQGSPLVAAYEVVEEQLGGAGVCDIMIPAPTTLDWAFLNQVRHLQNDLESRLGETGTVVTQGLTKVISLDDAVRAVMDLPNSVDVEPSVVQNLALQATVAQLRTRLPQFFDALYAENRGGQPTFRIMLRARERQSAAEKHRLIDSLQTTVREHFPQARITGFFVLLSGMIDSILRGQWTTFAMSVAGIGLVMAIALRDLRLVIMAMIPNVFPILCVMGMMGWLQFSQMSSLKINMGAAMIAAVSLGLSIDTSIHYLIDYQRGFQLHGHVIRTLQDAQSKVGQAMILSTLALIVGFGVLCTSDFIPTVYFGVLVSLAMLGSLLGNLLLIPLQLSWFPTAAERAGKP